MKIFLLILAGLVLLIPAIQSLGLIFALKRFHFREEAWLKGVSHYTRRGTYPHFFWNIRGTHSKLVRVMDWLSLFVLWGYIPYLLGEVMRALYKVFRRI